MSNRLSRLVAVVLVSFLAGVAGVWAQTGQVALATGPDISANRLESETNGWFHAVGNVFIRYADHDLHADRVDMNKTTGEVHARGHVDLFRQEQGRWSGDVLDYNYLTKEGLTGASEVRASAFAYTAEATQMESNGIKRLFGARLTTCNKTNDADWDYWLSASEIDFREHDRVTLHNAVWWFAGVPFFYFPYATRDLNHPFGPLIVPGYRSSWGPYLLTTYTYPYYNPPGTDILTGSVLLDYRALRGVAAGHEFDWNQEMLGNGFFGFYVTDDQKPGQNEDPNLPPIGSNRYRLYFHNAANPTPTDQILAQADILSDTRMMKDFFPSIYREQSQPDNFLSYTHRGLSYAAGGDVSGPLNNTFTAVGRAPEGWLKIFPQELSEDSGLYYESDSSVGYLVQQWTNDGTITNAFEPDTVRIHSQQKLTYPIQPMEGVSLVPRLAYDYTFYSHLANNRTNEVRSVFEAGMEASAKWFANYGEYRHIVEPYADLIAITSPINVKPGQNYFFDRVDGPRDWSDQFGLDGNYEPRRWTGIRPGVRNTIQEKDAEGNRRTVFDWDVFVAYRLGGQQGSTNSGLVLEGWDLTWRPEKDIKFRTEGLYDPKDGGRLDQSDTSVTFGEGSAWMFQVGYFTSDPLNPDILNPPVNGLPSGYNYLQPASVIYASLTHRFNSDWSANIFLNYDARSSALGAAGGYLQYELDCLAFRLNTSCSPAVTRTEGTHSTADYGVSLQVWVKAFQSGYIEKMRGW